MSAAFQSKGFDVLILAPSESLPEVLANTGAVNNVQKSEDPPAISRLWFPPIRGGGLLYRAGLTAKLKRRQPHFVYGRMLSGCRLAARMGIPTALEAHMPVWDHDVVKKRMFEDMTSRPAFAGVVVISHALEEALVDAFPALEERVVVAHDAASRRTCPGFRQPDPSRPVEVLYAGSLYPGKGMELLIRVAPRCPWARFRILGGTDDDIRKWQDLVPADVDNLEFLGRKPHSVVGDYMGSADILVAPYQSTVSAQGERRDIARWMSPLKIFEYMAANRPMVVSDLPVLREVLTDYRNALLVAPDDVEGWVAALDTLRREPELVRRLAATARADFERCHTWDARAAHTLESLGWEWNVKSYPKARVS